MRPHKNPFKVYTPFKRKGRLWSLGYHTGDDWRTGSVATTAGQPMYAMTDGIVRAVGFNRSYGYHAIIEVKINGRTVRWSFNHMVKPAKVKTGQSVKAGAVIGYVGSTGNSTGPHNHVEARVAPFTFSAAAFIDPQVCYDWAPPKRRPSWATLRPQAKPVHWYRAVGQNLGGMNDHGRATYKTRYVEIVADIKELAPDIVGVQELADPQVPYFDQLMKKAGYKRVAGSDGRYIYVKTGTPVKAAGVFDLQPRYNGDDKQAAWAVVTVDGHDAIPVVGHLEHEEGADNQRVGQAVSQITQAEGIAAKRGLSRTRIVHINDNNSNDWVRERAFNEHHYVDAMETAWKVTSFLKATFKGWGRGLPNGARIDSINVHRARPVLFAGTRVRNAGPERDHLMTVADIALITA
jgi:hypothetical protein